MFKAPIKVLHPLLTANQESNYVGTESVGAFSYQGIVLAQLDESEWQQFKGNKNNEAFLDRICVVKVPYCLRVRESILVTIPNSFKRIGCTFTKCCTQEQSVYKIYASSVIIYWHLYF